MAIEYKLSYTANDIDAKLGEIDNVVKYTSQNLSDEQQAQARQNIGVVGTGKDGKPPAKGVDYWTAADQESIVQDVIRALGTPVFGRVDANNNIILTGELADGTYTLKYEDAEGNVTVIGRLYTSPGYINWLTSATDADGNVYNGTGYKKDVRLSVSSGYTEYSMDGMDVYLTGYIPVKTGDILRFNGVEISSAADENYTGRLYLFGYADDGISIGSGIGSDSAIDYANVSGWTVKAEDGYVTEITYGGTDGFIRINADSISADAVITINQEIPEEEPTYINALTLAVEADGTPYNGGQGWKADTRLNSSGAEATAEGTEVTGFMPLKIGDVLRFKNIKITGTDTTNTTQYIVFYNSTKTKIKHMYTHQFYNLQSSQSSYFTLDADGYWKEYDTVNLKASDSSVDWSDLAFFRISAEEITDDSIITINQQISE